MDKILLIGAGGHARSCIDVIELQNKYKILGLVDKDKNNSDENSSYSIVGTDMDLKILREECDKALIAIGQIKSPINRIKLYEKLKKLNFYLPPIVSPKAYISKRAEVGEGTIVMHGSVINANAKVGKNCIVNNKTLIEHDVNVGDNCHIATGAIINGNVSIGSGTFIGSGSVIIQDISIGTNCVVGSGWIGKNNILSNQLVKK